MTMNTVTPVAPVTPAVAVAEAPVKSWAEQKGRLKSKFTILTDADLHFEEGKKDDMLTKVQVKLGKNKEELAAIIASL